MKNLKIYPDAYREYKDDREVDLTSREFELFLFLAQNSNIVFSKEKLFDRVWGWTRWERWRQLPYISINFGKK